MSIKRLFDAVERRGDIGRRVAALALPISNRSRVTSSCAGKIGLREPGEHTSGSLQRQEFDCAVGLARRVHWSLWRRATKSTAYGVRRGRRAGKLRSKLYECGPSSRRGGTRACFVHTTASVLPAGLRFDVTGGTPEAKLFGVMRDDAGCGAEVELRYLLPHPHQACSDVDDR